MRTWLTWLTWLVSVSVVGLLVAACGDDEAAAPSTVTPSTTTTTTTVAGEVLAAEDRAAILAAAAVHRVVEENSFGGADVFTMVDVVEVVGRPSGSGFIGLDGGVLLTDAERAAITAALAPRAVEFVPASTAQTPEGDEGYGILTLAEPVREGGRWTITTSVWCGSLCAIGGANLVGQDAAGNWVIGAAVGPQWIS